MDIQRLKHGVETAERKVNTKETADETTEMLATHTQLTTHKRSMGCYDRDPVKVSTSVLRKSSCQSTETKRKQNSDIVLSGIPPQEE